MSDIIFNFSDKNFVVVGASSGMGRQTALELAASGAHVLAIARNEERLLAVKAAYLDLIDVARLDVTTASDEQWIEAIGAFVERYGKLHGLVYTAGITGITSLRVHDGNESRLIMETNFWGAMKSLEIATKKKFSHEGGSYIIFSSTAAYQGVRGQLVYSGTKAAVQAAVRSIAKEISGRGQRINSISPGWVETEMTENYLEHMGQSPQEVSVGCFGKGNPQDVTGMVLFLLSDRAQWITGADYIVDGGLMFGR